MRCCCLFGAEGGDRVSPARIAVYARFAYSDARFESRGLTGGSGSKPANPRMISLALRRDYDGGEHQQARQEMARSVQGISTTSPIPATSLAIFVLSFHSDATAEAIDAPSFSSSGSLLRANLAAISAA